MKDDGHGTVPFAVTDGDMGAFACRPEMPDRTMLIFCTAGQATVCIDMDEYDVDTGVSLLVFPHKTVFVRRATDDFHVTCLAFCREILDEIVAGLTTTLILYIRSHPLIRLSRTDRSFFGAMNEQIRRVSTDVQQLYKNKIVANIVSNFLLIHYGSLSVLDDIPESQYNRGEELFKRFLTDIEIFCGSSHNVTEYADRLCITPKYLTEITRRKTGKSPKEMIDEVLLRRAMSNLKNSGKSVKEISIECGFQNPDYFSRFFRRMTDMTPQAYRRSISR